MTNVAIIGATGSLGRSLREELKNNKNYNVTLFSRHVDRLSLYSNEKAISGSATSSTDLDQALANQDIVFVALSGDLPKMATEIVASMKRVGVARIVFVSSMGIYGEVAGEPKGVVAPILKPYRKAADIVEQSGLDYTILRPGWFDNGQDSTCQITQKGETFYGHDVSRKAIVTLVKQIIDQPAMYVNTSLGLYR
ncbi:MAG: NAD-dependent epimerase/dehydratase family protein [Streptococcus gallolyticus]|uniref:NAD-dependent epimerase/dehydratase family protein n=1 Tax=Streptococcus gallolyticus TaxID=315405 RepID=A0A927XHN5_9STRE|nr:NAD-dependent epimerase/dehydratase family protein [Streptococcus gallolyticus]